MKYYVHKAREVFVSYKKIHQAPKFRIILPILRIRCIFYFLVNNFFGITLFPSQAVIFSEFDIPTLNMSNYGNTFKCATYIRQRLLVWGASRVRLAFPQ